MTLIETLPGESIIFNDNLLHGGALNLGTNTRISTEFTILKNKYQIKNFLQKTKNSHPRRTDS